MERRPPPWKPQGARGGQGEAGEAEPESDGLRRILVIDDEPSMRQWVRQVLEAGCYAVKEASCGEAGVAIADGERIDGAVVDIMMPGAELEGIGAARILWYERHIPCIMLTSQIQGGLRLAATYAGAWGYLIKERVTADLVRVSVAQMLAGERIEDHVDRLNLSAAERASINALRTEMRRRQQLLTPREQQIEGLIIQGKSNREIAETIGIQRKTVDTHVSNMLGKLGMVTRREMQVLFESTWN